MKYISEDAIEEYSSKCDRIDLYACYQLMDRCTELDELTVSKLRPMSEAPMDGTVFLAIFEDGDLFRECFYTGEDGLFMCDDFDEVADNFKGWIPMPQYKPEE